jgi:tRNA pseudouridine55 synthase
VKSGAVHGVLVVDKPVGPTSHDLVAGARRLFGTRKVGHAGTLDPMASGVLVLLFGEATKLSPFLSGHDKRYSATVVFGRATDTLDALGATTEEREPPRLELGALSRALEQELGRSEQVPPLFSAISIGGRRAHRIGRSGDSVELPPRPVAVRKLGIIARDERSLSVELEVTKGYYVRAFARDLGARLGVPAHLGALRRLSSGPFSLDEAAPWPALEPPALLPLAAAALRALPSGELTAEGEARARFGKALTLADFARPPPEGPGTTAWIGPGGELIALGAERAPGVHAVVRGFVSLSAP